ncbi:flagellar hook assembly protein FlgD [Microvirga sp. 2TAF3]|uniref:flagellar hook assembly protein FlgD n=1 Tax=Microvirga sp. 2TAF3 TaxID=3233014 RepID=UPI003F97DEE2
MDVSSVNTGLPTQRSTNSKAPAPTLGYDNFLQLLLTQMKNQDPTAPMESTEYMAQLATFSQVEQQTKTNSKLDALLSASALGQANSVIGRTITSADGTVSGEVKSVKIYDDGIMATLTNGKDVLLGSGIVIS